MNYNKKIGMKAIEKHFEFQIGMYFSNLEKNKNFWLLYSDLVGDNYWNYAGKINIDKEKIEDVIGEVEEYYLNKNRTPAFYLTPFIENSEIRETLQKEGYEIIYEDAWMFFESDKFPPINSPDNLKIDSVKSKEDVETFVKLFGISYGGGSEEDLYSGLPEYYGKALKRSFSKKFQNKNIINYIGRMDSKPVGIATLINKGKYSAIYNMGVIPEFRSKGIGSALTLHPLRESRKLGADHIFLQTEKDSKVENFYEKLKFKTKFTGKCSALKQ